MATEGINNKIPLPACGSCVFWREIDLARMPNAPKGVRIGQCRFNPPTVFMAAQQGVGGMQPVPLSFSPQTEARETCASHPETVAAMQRIKGQAWREGEQSALYYDRARRDLNRVPSPEELEALRDALQRPADKRD